MNFAFYHVKEFKDLVYKKYLKTYQDKLFKYLDLSYSHDDNFIVLFDDQNNQLIGFLQFRNSAYEKEVCWLIVMEILPEYRGKKLATFLLDKLCHHLISLNYKRLDLSQYELEGEVLIPTVQKIAQQYPEIKIRHKKINTPYQDGDRDFFVEKQIVFVDDPESGYVGKAQIYYFITHVFPNKIKLICENNEKTQIEVSFDKIKPIN